MKKTFDRSKQFSAKRSESRGPKRFESESRSSGRSDKPFGASRSRERSGGRDSFDSSSKMTPKGFELHQAICAKCGQECDVPFKPTGNKPVYCRSCFRENEGSAEPRGRSNDFERNAPSRDRFRDAPQRSSPSSDDLEKINRKLDKIMRALKIE